MVVVSAVLTIAAMAYGETIRFAPLPMEDRETVVKQFRPLTTFLEQRLKVTITYEYSESYADILKKFCDLKVDLAYLGPLPYVELRNAYPQAQPLVHFKEKSGEATYTCALVAFPDTGFDAPSARKKTIALTQPLSTCGYLSTCGLMRRLGGSIEENFYRYLNQHDAVALAVIRGEFDAGGLKTTIARKFTHMGLQIIAETPPMPGFAMVANMGTLSPEKADLIRRELIALDPGAKDKTLVASWGENIRHGAVMAADGDYQVVRELLGGKVIPPEGNF